MSEHEEKKRPTNDEIVLLDMMAQRKKIAEMSFDDAHVEMVEQLSSLRGLHEFIATQQKLNNKLENERELITVYYEFCVKIAASCMVICEKLMK